MYIKKCRLAFKILTKSTMKNLILIMTLVFISGKVTAQNQFFFITGLNITQLNEAQIKVNLKIVSEGYCVYNSYTTEITGDVITLKVCYDGYFFDSGSSDNDFFIDIPSASGNYTLNVEIYGSGSNGCIYQSAYLQDSATLDFTNPFTGTISLSTIDTENLNKKIILYPNPVKNILHFSEEVSIVKITDLSGKMVKQFNATAKSIDVSILAKGNYLITVTTKTGKVITRKLMKE